MKNRILKKLRLWFLACIMLTACEKETQVYLEPYTEEGKETETEMSQTEQSDSIGQAPEEEQLLYVYVCGAVLYPGVYALPEGSRVCDAIALAGGLCEEADELSVNQAELVTDGQMLRIYTYSETAEGLDQIENSENGNTDVISEADSRININTATRTQLMTLPGIGSAKADAIIAYRTEKGAFRKPEDLMMIPGIKEGVFEQIKKQIRIE